MENKMFWTWFRNLYKNEYEKINSTISENPLFQCLQNELIEENVFNNDADRQRSKKCFLDKENAQFSEKNGSTCNLSRGVEEKSVLKMYSSNQCLSLENVPFPYTDNMVNGHLVREDDSLIEGSNGDQNQETYYSSINSGYGTKSLTYNLSSDVFTSGLGTELLLESSLILPRRRLGNEGAPKDTFFLVHLAAYFLGMTAMLPVTFFVVANDYWMYKFRDVSQGEYNLNNKTYSQTMFVSMSSACSSFPCLISVLLTILFGYKIDRRKTIIISLGTESFLFAISTALIKINTDTWQYPFFILTLAIMSIVAFIQPLLGITIMSYLSKFPHSYVEWNLYGSAAGGLFGSTLQIISLSIGKNSLQIALIYFSTGTILICFTCFLTYAIKYSSIVQHYVEHSGKLHKTKHTLKEYWRAANKVWFIILLMILSTLGAGIGHPNITNLIVSEGYTGTGTNMWCDKYFSAVAIYFLYDISTLFGRLLGRPIVKKSNCHWFFLMVIFRTYVVGILFWFCNAQPRNYLPVWFSRDYQYMSIMVFYGFLGSVLATSAILSIAPVAKEKTEMAYILLLSSMSTIQTFASLLNPTFVQLL